MFALNTSIHHGPRSHSKFNKARKINKGINKGQEEVKLSVCVDNMLMYIEYPLGIF